METLLDEATAELGKLEFSPMLATIEISFRIVKAVPLHTTLRIDCEARACFRYSDAQIFHTRAHAKALPALHAACGYRCVRGSYSHHACHDPAAASLAAERCGPKDLPTSLPMPCGKIMTHVWHHKPASGPCNERSMDAVTD